MWGKPSSSRSEVGSSSQSLRRKSSTSSSKSKHKTRPEVGGSNSRHREVGWEDEPRRGESSRKSRALPDEESSPPRTSVSNRGEKASRTTAEPSSRLEKGSEPRRRSRTGILSDRDRPSTIPNQFPDQAPQDWAMPFKVGSANQYGSAADFYNDQGESVQHQPGVRPATPIVTGTEPHLMAALPVAAPPVETGNGSAADFYSGAFAAPAIGTPSDADASHQPPIEGRPQRPTRPSKPPSHHSSSGIPMAAAGAAGASAAAYAYHQQHHTSNHQGSLTTPSKLSSRPSAHPPPTHPLPPSIYAPGTFANYHEQRQHRGPLGKFMDWWNDYDDVRKMEDYTEYIGVCKYCFDPHSTVRDAPRKHRPVRRRSREFSHRVDKDSRYGRPSSPSSSGSSDHERDGAGLIGAGLAGLGFAAATSSVKRDKGRADVDTHGSQRQTRLSDTHPSKRRKASDYIGEASTLETPIGASHVQTRDDDSSSQRIRRSSHRPGKDLPHSANAGMITSAGAGYAASELSREHVTGDNFSHGSRRLPTGQAHLVHRRNSSGSSSSSSSNRGILSRVFSPSSRKDKQRKSRKSPSSAYKMKPPAQSTASDLAYHDEPALMRRTRTRRRSSSPMNATKAVAGLSAAAALMAAADSRRNRKSKMQPEVFAVREPRLSHSAVRSDRHWSRASVAEEWEDVSDNDTASSSSSGLAFGADLSVSSSSESVNSIEAEAAAAKRSPRAAVRSSGYPAGQQSGRRPYFSRPPEPPQGTHKRDYTQSRQQPSSPSVTSRSPRDRAPLHSLDPIPDSRSSPIHDQSPPLRSRLKHLPLQQPQPILPVRPPSHSFAFTVDDASTHDRRAGSPAEPDRRRNSKLGTADDISKASRTIPARRASRDENSWRSHAVAASQEPAWESRHSSPPEASPSAKQRRRTPNVLAGVAEVAAAGATYAAFSSRAQRRAASPPPPSHDEQSSESRQKRPREASDRPRAADAQAYSQKHSPVDNMTRSQASASPQSAADGDFTNKHPTSGGSEYEAESASWTLSNVDDVVISEQAADNLRFQTEAREKHRSSFDDADIEIDHGKTDVAEDSTDVAIQHELREANVRSNADELSSDEDIFDPNFFRKRHQPPESSATTLADSDRSTKEEQQEATAYDPEAPKGVSVAGKTIAGVPLINIIKPTPPQSVAGSVRDPHSRSSSPLHKEFKLEDVRDLQNQPAKAKRRVTWGEDEFNIYQIESPESVRDEYFAPHQHDAARAAEDTPVLPDERRASQPPPATSTYHPPRVEPSASPDLGVTDADPLKGDEVPVLVLNDHGPSDEHFQPNSSSPVMPARSIHPSDAYEASVARDIHSAYSPERDRDLPSPPESSMPGSFFEDNYIEGVKVGTQDPSTRLQQSAGDAQTGNADVGFGKQAILRADEDGADEDEADEGRTRLPPISKGARSESKKDRKKKMKKKNEKSSQSATEVMEPVHHGDDDTISRPAEENHSHDGFEAHRDSPTTYNSSKRRSLTEWNAPAEPQTSPKVGKQQKKEKSGSLWGLFRRSGSENGRAAKVSRSEVCDDIGAHSASSARMDKSRRSSVAVDSSDVEKKSRRRRSDSTSSNSQRGKHADKRDPFVEPRRPRSEPPPSDEDSGRRSQVPIFQVNLSALGVESTPYRTTMADSWQDPLPIERSTHGTDHIEIEEPGSYLAHANTKDSSQPSDEEVGLRMSHSIDSLAELERERKFQQGRAVATDEFEPPESYNDVPEMIRLPQSRPQSPYSEPARPVAANYPPQTPLVQHPDKASNTSVPLRFRAPLSSPLAPRESPVSTPGPSQTNDTSPTSSKRAARAHRPGSAEFRTSGEYRPLWLPSKYVASAAPEVEESLPSLPSSRTSSEVGGDDTYESAVSSLRSSPQRHPSEADTDAWYDFAPSASPQDEYLDSQQATPKAGAYSAQNMPEVPHFDLDGIEDHDQFSLPEPRPQDILTRMAYGVTTFDKVPSLETTPRRASLPASTDFRSDDRQRKRSNSVAALAAAATIGAAGGAWLRQSRDESSQTIVDDNDTVGSRTDIQQHEHTPDFSPAHPSPNGRDVSASQAHSDLIQKQRSPENKNTALEGKTNASDMIKKDRPTPLEGLATSDQSVDPNRWQSARREAAPPTKTESAEAQQNEVWTDASSSRNGEQVTGTPLTARRSPDAQDLPANEPYVQEAALTKAEHDVLAYKRDYHDSLLPASKRDSDDSSGRALSNAHWETDGGPLADAQAMPLPPDQDDDLDEAQPPGARTMTTGSGAFTQAPGNDQLHDADAGYIESLINRKDRLQGSNNELSFASENGKSAHALDSDTESRAYLQTPADTENPSLALPSQSTPVGDEQGSATILPSRDQGAATHEKALAEDVSSSSTILGIPSEQAEPVDEATYWALYRKEKKKQKKTRKGKSPSADIGKSLATVEVDDDLAQGHTSRSIPVDVAQADPVHPEHDIEAQRMVPRPEESSSEQTDALSVGNATDLLVGDNQSAQAAHERGSLDEVSDGEQAAQQQSTLEHVTSETPSQKSRPDTSETTNVRLDASEGRPLSKTERKQSKKKKKTQQAFDWDDEMPSVGASNAMNAGARAIEQFQPPDTSSNAISNVLEDVKDPNSDLRPGQGDGFDSSAEGNPVTVTDSGPDTGAEEVVDQDKPRLPDSAEFTLSIKEADSPVAADKSTPDTRLPTGTTETGQALIAVPAAVQEESPSRSMLNTDVGPNASLEDVQHTVTPSNALEPEGTLFADAAEEGLDSAVPMSSKGKKKAKKAKQKAQKAFGSTRGTPPPEAIAPDSEQGTKSLADGLTLDWNPTDVNLVSHYTTEEHSVFRPSSKQEKKKGKRNANRPSGLPDAGAAIVVEPTDDEWESRPLSKKEKKRAEHKANEPLPILQDVPDTEEVDHTAARTVDQSSHDAGTGPIAEPVDEEWQSRPSSKKDKKKAKKAKDKASPSSKPEQGIASFQEPKLEFEKQGPPITDADVYKTQNAPNVIDHDKSKSFSQEQSSELPPSHTLDKECVAEETLPVAPEATSNEAQDWDFPAQSKKDKKRSKKAKKQQQWVLEPDEVLTSEEQTTSSFPRAGVSEDIPPVSTDSVSEDVTGAADIPLPSEEVSAAMRTTANEEGSEGRSSSNESAQVEASEIDSAEDQHRVLANDEWTDAARQPEELHRPTSRNYEELRPGQEDDKDDRTLPSPSSEFDSKSNYPHKEDLSSHDYAAARTLEDPGHDIIISADHEDPKDIMNDSAKTTQDQTEPNASADAHDAATSMLLLSSEPIDVQAQSAMVNDEATLKADDPDSDLETWHDTTETENIGAEPKRESEPFMVEEVTTRTEPATDSQETKAEASSDKTMPTIDIALDDVAKFPSQIDAEDITVPDTQRDIDGNDAEEASEEVWSLKPTNKKDKKKAQRLRNPSPEVTSVSLAAESESGDIAGLGSQSRAQNEASPEQVSKPPDEDEWTLRAKSKKDKKKAKKDKIVSAQTLPVAVAATSFASEAMDPTGDEGKGDVDDVETNEHASENEWTSKPLSKKDKKKSRKGRSSLADVHPSSEAINIDAASGDVGAVEPVLDTHDAARVDEPREVLRGRRLMASTSDNEDEAMSGAHFMDYSASRSLEGFRSGADNMPSAAPVALEANLPAPGDVTEDAWAPTRTSKKNKKKDKEEKKAKGGDIMAPLPDETTFSVLAPPEEQERDNTFDAFQQVRVPILETESATKDSLLSENDKEKEREKAKKAKQQTIMPEVQLSGALTPLQTTQADAAPHDLLDDILVKPAESVSAPDDFPLSKKEKKKKAKNLKKREQVVEEAHEPASKESLVVQQVADVTAEPTASITEELEDPSGLRGSTLEPPQPDKVASEIPDTWGETDGDHVNASAPQEGGSKPLDLGPDDQSHESLLSEDETIQNPHYNDVSEDQLDLAFNRQTAGESARQTTSPFETVVERVQAAVREVVPESGITTGVPVVESPEHGYPLELAKSHTATSPEKPTTAANDENWIRSAVPAGSGESAGTMSVPQPSVNTGLEPTDDPQLTTDQDLLPGMELPTAEEVHNEHNTLKDRETPVVETEEDRPQLEGEGSIAVDVEQQTQTDEQIWTALPKSKSMKKKAKKDKARQLEATSIEDESPIPATSGPDYPSADALQESTYTIMPTSRGKKKKGKKGKEVGLEEDIEEPVSGGVIPLSGPQEAASEKVVQPSLEGQRVLIEPTNKDDKGPEAREPPSEIRVGAFDGSNPLCDAMSNGPPGQRRMSGAEEIAQNASETPLEGLSLTASEKDVMPQEELEPVESRPVLSPSQSSRQAEVVAQDQVDDAKPPVEGLPPRSSSTTEGYVTVADLDKSQDPQQNSIAPAVTAASQVLAIEATEAPMPTEAAPGSTASEGEEESSQRAIAKPKKLSKKEKRKGKKGKLKTNPTFEEDDNTTEAVDPATGGAQVIDVRRPPDNDSSEETQLLSGSTNTKLAGDVERQTSPEIALLSDAAQSSAQASQDAGLEEPQEVSALPMAQTYWNHGQSDRSPKSQRSQSPSQLWGSNSHVEEDTEREPLVCHRSPTADVDFAATLAAGLQDSGFDPELAANPDFHEQDNSASPGLGDEVLPPRSGSNMDAPELPSQTWSFSRVDEATQERTVSSTGAADPYHVQAHDLEFDDAVTLGLREGGFDPEHAAHLSSDNIFTTAHQDQDMAQKDAKLPSRDIDGAFAVCAGVSGDEAPPGDSGPVKRSKQKSKKKSRRMQLVEDDNESMGSPSGPGGFADDDGGPPGHQLPREPSPNNDKRAAKLEGLASLSQDSHPNSNAKFRDHEPIRDSGYQGSIPETSLVEDRHFGNDAEVGHDRGSPSPSVEAVPAKRESSDVESTSKERSSALFRSPPAPPRDYQEQTALASPTQDAHLTTPGLEELEEGRGVDPFETEEEQRASYGSELEPIQEDNTEQAADEEDNVGILSGSRAVSASDQPKLDVSTGISYSSYVSPSTSEVANTRRRYRRSSSIESRGSIRPPSATSARARTSGSIVSQRSTTPTLHRSNPSSDLGTDYRCGSGLAPSQPQSSDLDFDTALANDGRKRRQSYDSLKGSGKDRRVMSSDQGIYEGYGDVHETPRSPSRPQSLRKRQSMQVIDLENRLEQAIAENGSLRQSRGLSSELQIKEPRLAETLRARDEQLRERDVEISSIRTSLGTLQQEVARLSEHNAQLSAAHVQFSANADERSAVLEAERDHAHAQWQACSHELDQLRDEHGALRGGMEAAVGREISAALSDKNAEIKTLQAQLDSATQKIRTLQQQILASKTADSFLNYKDEDFFESACAQLCQHVQAWVLRFSKFSDMRFCRSLSELHDETTEGRLDNAILDGTDADQMLADRVLRRDVFMSVVMTLIWEFVFTRYLFGMDREQRQKLKNLEKILSEVGPQSAVAQWRATTLTLLSRRTAFADQRLQDTEAVVQEIYGTLAAVLPPPQNLIGKIQESLRNVMRLAVDLSIDMRTQRPEYMMLPPLRPEYDANGDLAKKVYFNAGLMNERSGEFKDNEELEDRQATVRLVLFPLVVRRGDDKGEGTEEIVISPAQVHVSREIARRDKRGLMVGGHANKSTMSVAAPSIISGGDMV